MKDGGKTEGGERVLPDLDSVKSEAWQRLSETIDDPQRLKDNVALAVFIAAEPQQVTIELVRDLIQAKANVYKKWLEDSIEPEEGERKRSDSAELNFAERALKELDEKDGDKKEAIRFLRREAGLCRQIAEEAKERIDNGGPFLNPPDVVGKEFDKLWEKSGLGNTNKPRQGWLSSYLDDLDNTTKQTRMATNFEKAIELVGKSKLVILT